MFCSNNGDVDCPSAKLGVPWENRSTLTEEIVIGENLVKFAECSVSYKETGELQKFVINPQRHMLIASKGRSEYLLSANPACMLQSTVLRAAKACSAKAFQALASRFRNKPLRLA
ncbi:hypothetical protein O181_039262 [Austropuccinia psidii MF-1]|uniref:Uncharacterized protein n=1 Tax=Austropuccinia psidii MF-1 TaxID=1389203 RepID=A0A9Q3DGF6_9BASI|nr:hypothetical protein [Austropuccinia psidii MF-1]